MESNKKVVKTKLTIYIMKPIQYKQMSMAQEKKICINMLNYKLCDYLMEIGFSFLFKFSPQGHATFQLSCQLDHVHEMKLPAGH